jgi:hypothetical protein
MDTEWCLLFDNERDPWQRVNLFGTLDARSLQQALHRRLIRTIIDSGECVPEYVENQ